MAALHQPEPRENPQPDPSPKQLDWLVGARVAVPLWCLESGLSRKHAGILIELLKQDAYGVKRPCRRCGAFRMAVSPADDRHALYWGRPIGEDERLGYVCVECLRKPPREKPGPRIVPPPVKRSPLIELLNRARRETVPPPQSSPDGTNSPRSEFTPPPPAAAEPAPRLHPTAQPSIDTIRLVEHLARYWDGLLDSEMMADALLGRTVVIYRGKRRHLVELEADELPCPGPELLRAVAEEDFETACRLISGSFRVLETRGRLRLDAEGNWRIVAPSGKTARDGFESAVRAAVRALRLDPTNPARKHPVPDPATVETYRRFREEVRELSGGNPAIERLRVQGRVYESGQVWTEAAWQTVSGLT